MPTASEIKNNYINSNFHKSLNQPLVVKSRVELPEVQRSRQVLTQAKGPAELSQIHGLADLPLPKINLLETGHSAGEGDKEAAGGESTIKNGGSLLNLQNFTPMNTLPRKSGDNFMLQVIFKGTAPRRKRLRYHEMRRQLIKA
jgi:hypothetical protein